MTPKPESRSPVLLVTLLVTGAALLLLLLASLRVMRRRVSGGNTHVPAMASAETALKTLSRRARGEEGPALVRAAGFSLERRDGPWLRLETQNGTSADLERPRFLGTSGDGGSDLGWVNQTGFVTESWSIMSVGHSPSAGESFPLRANLQLGPVPFDIARLPEPE